MSVLLVRKYTCWFTSDLRAIHPQTDIIEDTYSHSLMVFSVQVGWINCQRLNNSVHFIGMLENNEKAATIFHKPEDNQVTCLVWFSVFCEKIIKSNLYCSTKITFLPELPWICWNLYKYLIHQILFLRHGINLLYIFCWGGYIKVISWFQHFWSNQWGTFVGIAVFKQFPYR